MDINDPRLTAYVLGELEEVDRQVIENALEDSPELRREVEAIRDGVAILSTGLQAEPCPSLTDDQRRRIDEGCDASLSMRAESRQGRAPRRPNR